MFMLIEGAIDFARAELLLGGCLIALVALLLRLNPFLRNLTGGLLIALIAFLLDFVSPRRILDCAEQEYRQGTPLDISALSPRIERVRQDYLAALHFSPHPRAHKA